MKKALLAFICIIAVFIQMPVVALAATTETITFNQMLSVTNNRTYDVDDCNFAYAYALTPETEDLTGVVSGIDGGVTLDTASVVFSNFVVSASSSKELTSPISLTVDVSKFSAAGIYRYRLTNSTTNDYVFLDVSILEESGNLVLASYNFYNKDLTKSTGFVDRFTLEPVLVDCNVIFRFVDQNGTLIADDISFNETREQTVRVASGVMVIDLLGATITVANGTDAYSQYEVILANLKSQGYTVISDEVAAHGNSGYWSEIGVQKIYTVKMQAPSNPTPTPEPTPPSNPTPTLPPDAPKTGDDRNPMLYVGIAMISVTVIVGGIAYIIIRKKRRD